MKIEPLQDRVLLKPVEPTETTRGGLFIPASAQEVSMQGTVVAVGPGKMDETGSHRIPVSINVGDVVLYGKYAGAEVEGDGETYLLVREADIVAILRKE